MATILRWLRNVTHHDYGADLEAPNVKQPKTASGPHNVPHGLGGTTAGGDTPSDCSAPAGPFYHRVLPRTYPVMLGDMEIGRADTLREACEVYATAGHDLGGELPLLEPGPGGGLRWYA